MGKDATWYGSRPQPRPHCVRWGPSSPPWQKEHNSPLFSAHVYCGHRRPSQVLLSSCSVTLYIYLFGRPFVKRFTLSYRIVVCLSCLSVTLVYCGQVVRWIRMPLGTKVCLGPGNIVLDGNPGSPPQKRGTAPSHFSVHVYSDQMVVHVSNC